VPYLNAWHGPYSFPIRKTLPLKSSSKSKEYQVQCSYETVVRFFHKQAYALKTPQPWPDKQNEQLREVFLQ